MSRTIQVGTHSVTREASGLLFVRYVGDCAAHEMVAILDAIEVLGQKDILALNDLTALGDVSPAARKIVAQDRRSGLFRAIGVFGGGFTVRILVNMSVTAARTLGVGITAPIVFFETEAKARAWLDEQKARTA